MMRLLRHRNGLSLGVLTLGVGLSCLLLAGCARQSQSGTETTPARAGAPLVWPAPPAPARILHVMQVAKPRDLGVKVSTWNRLANFFSGGDRGNAALVTPSGVAFDEADNLCVTDAGAGAVLYFDLSRRTCQRWEQIGKRRLVSPISVAKAGDTLYVVDAGLQSLLAFTTEGKLLFELTNQVQRPTGVTIQAGKLYVADAPAHEIAVFDLAGKFQFKFGRRGSGPGELNFPTHLAGNGTDRLFVTDSMNSRVLVFNLAGEYHGTISSRGDTTGHLNRPKGIGVDGQGHVYVVDALFDNFQIFDAAGRFLLNVGSAGSKPGEFWLPAGIAINRKQQIFVADSYNHRLQVFQYVGNP